MMSSQLNVVLVAWLLALLPPGQLTGLEPGYWERTPLPQTGLATFYAQGMMEHVLDVRAGHGQIFACPECVGTVALLRAGDIGRKVWLQPPGGERIGPFMVIDCARQEDVWPLVERNWVVDVSFEVGQFWAMDRPLDEVTVLADPADADYSGLEAGPLRVPTPFTVPADKVVLTAPTPTPAITSTPDQPTPWPTRLPLALKPATALPGAETPQPMPTRSGPLPPTPLTPVVTKPTSVAPPGTPPAPLLAAAATPAPAQSDEPPIAVGRPGVGVLDPLAKVGVSTSAPPRLRLTASPTATIVRRTPPASTAMPILPPTPFATPGAPIEDGGLLDLLRSILDRLRQ
jgi:hypothetical protein